MRRRAKGEALLRKRNPGGERLALRMLIREGELIYNHLQWRVDFVDDAETAVERLRAGKVVWVAQNGPLITQVQRAIEGREEKATA